MHAYRVETTAPPDGSLAIRHLPLQAGEAVEVIILVRPPLTAITRRYPLRGAPITYRAPTESIVASDWEATR
jgi:uncharacterized membrane protein